MSCTPDFIGLYQFLSLEGGIEAIKPTFERVDRPGVDGMAYRALGYKAKEFQLLSTIDLASIANAANAEADYLAYVGQVKTIVQKGISYNNMLVLDVGNFQKQILEIGLGGLTNGGGTASAVLLRATWTFVNLY